MAYSEEYRSLLEDAEVALEALLDASTQDSWLALRMGYGEIRRTLNREDRERARIAKLEERIQQRREIEQAWTGLTLPARESLVLQVLGDAELSVSVLADRVNHALVGEDSWPAVFPNQVRSLIAKMFGAGQLDRGRVPGTRQVRYVYFRKRGLEGPIAELERTYRGEVN